MDAIRKWWNKKISGKRCAQVVGTHLILVLVVVGAAGIGAGALAGTSTGSAFGPGPGTVVGAVVGAGIGIGGIALMKWKIEKLTLKIFDLPQDAALENAYIFFGTSQHATNDEVNRTYKYKASYMHPDKGGSKEEFAKLTNHLGVIRAARGQLLKNKNSFN